MHSCAKIIGCQLSLTPGYQNFEFHILIAMCISGNPILWPVFQFGHALHLKSIEIWQAIIIC